MNETVKFKTADDCDQIRKPSLTPHFEFRLIGGEKILLISETFNTMLHGAVYENLLPLLDGCRSSKQIFKALKAIHPESEVRAALEFLATRGYIVSGNHEMERSKAAFWSALGASPSWVEKQLREATVTVDGDDGRLAKHFDSMGIAVGDDQPSLSVFVCTDYLDERYAAISRHHIASGRPWVLVRPKGIEPLFGPIFRPGDNSFCWGCLAYRLRNHQEVHTFVRNSLGESFAFQPHAAEPAVLEAVYGIIATEIAKWLVLGSAAPIHEQAVTLNVARMKIALHPVTRRPQCATCGSEELRKADRPIHPIRLQSQPGRFRTSSGVRVASPAQTLSKYRHLVSPVSGIVTWVARTTEDTDPWLHVHWAGSNLALRIKSLNSLRRSLRSKSAGKGSTAEQSEVSALCEAIERYCGVFHGDEIRCRKRQADFSESADEAAIHPNDVQLFSSRQLDHAQEINARGHPYNVVPPRFDAERELDWSPVWSLTEDRARYLPTALLYGMTPEQRHTAGLWADSNGCAAGNTLEEAILQGFFELVERDAFSIWWYNRLHVPAVNLESFDDDYLAAARDYYRKYHREMWVLDITSDLGIPTFVALSSRVDGEAEDIIYGAGAHSDPQIAILRAVCEMNQCLTWVPHPQQEHSRYGVDDPMCLRWWKTGKLTDHPHLEPAHDIEPRNKSSYAVLQSEDLREDVEWCRSLVAARGMDLLVLDQTRPDIGMPVVRVIVPGLRHFWERFAPGRLFEVPVAMGWRTHALDEADLNPVPVIA